MVRISEHQQSAYGQMLTDIRSYYRTNDAWQYNPEHAADFAARNRTPIFSLAAPNLMDRELPKRVFLPKYFVAACREKYGNDWVYYPQFQKRGTCVGQSHKSGVDMIMAIARYIAGTRFLGRSAVCTTYSGGRVEVGNWVSRKDGSVGSWTADWLTKKKGTGGVVLLSEVGLPEDSRNEDEQNAVKWAAMREGCPKKYEDIARQRPVKGASLCTSTDEAAAGLANLCFLNLCAQIIPKGRRGSDGTASCPRGGGHSTGCVGYRTLDNGKRVFAYFQSWGPRWASGPYGWQDEDPDGFFKGCIVDIHENDLARFLKSRDCYLLWGAAGIEPISQRYFL